LSVWACAFEHAVPIFISGVHGMNLPVHVMHCGVPTERPPATGCTGSAPIVSDIPPLDVPVLKAPMVSVPLRTSVSPIMTTKDPSAALCNPTSATSVLLPDAKSVTTTMTFIVLQADHTVTDESTTVLASSKGMLTSVVTPIMSMPSATTA